MPGKISHHKCTVIGDKMILVGGIRGDTSNGDTWIFDLKTNTWEVGKSSGEIPLAMDDHTLVQVDKQLVVFGGFGSEGTRVNSVHSAQVNVNNTVVWSQLSRNGPGSKTCPVERNSHSAVSHGASIFVFGGQDDENNKLGDLWEFNTTTKQWA
jgi:N-acetylneuraminic acid mutarotase